MTLTLTQKELLVLINDYLKSEPRVDRISIEIKTRDEFADIISFTKDNWFIGSFLKEEIKNEKRS